MESSPTLKQPVAILTDTTLCTGCEACVQACRSTYRLGRDRAWRWKKKIDDLSSTRFTTIIRRPGGRSVRHQCRHCLEPACVSACIVGALQKTDIGPVIYDESRCMGCRYCMMACPYKARSFVHENLSNQKPDVPRGKGCVESCTLCVHRVDRGGTPACVEACAQAGHKAMLFGDLNDPSSEIAQQVKTYATTRLRADLRLNTGVYYRGM